MEQRQLPPDFPNIIIIENNDLFFGNIKKVINELEEELYIYPHLLFTIITGGHSATDRPISIMVNQHAFIRKNLFDTSVSQTIILLNRYCNFKISPSTITKIYTAFANY